MERRPLSDIPPSRQPSNALASDDKRIYANYLQHRDENEGLHERQAGSLGGTLPRHGHGGPPGHSCGSASDRTTSAQKQPEVPDEVSV